MIWLWYRNENGEVRVAHPDFAAIGAWTTMETMMGLRELAVRHVKFNKKK